MIHCITFYWFSRIVIDIYTNYDPHVIEEAPESCFTCKQYGTSLLNKHDAMPPVSASCLRATDGRLMILAFWMESYCWYFRKNGPQNPLDILKLGKKRLEFRTFGFKTYAYRFLFFGSQRAFFFRFKGNKHADDGNHFENVYIGLMKHGTLVT